MKKGGTGIQVQVRAQARQGGRTLECDDKLCGGLLGH